MKPTPHDNSSTLSARLIHGGIAGLAATAPMTALMVVAHQREPWHERDPLPPALITAELREALGVAVQLPRPAQAGLATVNHFSYGALMGALYGLLPPPLVRDHPIASGAAFGLAVWAGNYLAALPLLDLHRSARCEREYRNRLMIAAHLVWGLGTGLLAAAMNRERAPR